MTYGRTRKDVPWQIGQAKFFIGREKEGHSPNCFQEIKITLIITKYKKNGGTYFFIKIGNFYPSLLGGKNAFAAKRFRKRGEKKENPIIVIVCPNQQLEDSSSFWKQLF